MSDRSTETPVTDGLAVSVENVAERQELRRLADETAVDAQAYLDALTEVAAGSAPDTAIPVLLLALSQTSVAGARLGAISDVVPSERFEPDAGPDPDVDPVRAEPGEPLPRPRRLRRRRRPADQPRGRPGEPRRRPRGRRDRARPRPQALPRRPRRRGPVVVAVLVPVDVGRPRHERAARPADGARPPAARRRPRHRRGRRVRGAARQLTRDRAGPLRPVLSGLHTARRDPGLRARAAARCRRVAHRAPLTRVLSPCPRYCPPRPLPTGAPQHRHCSTTRRSGSGVSQGIGDAGHAAPGHRAADRRLVHRSPVRLLCHQERARRPRTRRAPHHDATTRRRPGGVPAPERHLWLRRRRVPSVSSFVARSRWQSKPSAARSARW